jgi:probable O-glycosylation ligase (exosortase A-associated)
MRDILVLAIIIIGVPVSAVRPVAGILLWCWVSYMNPHRLGWGIAYDFPVAQAIALGTLVGIVFTRDRSPLPRERETVLLGCLWVLFTITTVVALNPVDAWARWTEVSKILLMTFVTMILVNNRPRLRLLLLTIALSIGFFGFKGGIFGFRSGGSGRVYGPPGSFIEDNNDLALALLMVLPLLFYLAKDEPRKWLRLLLRATGLLSIIAVVFTYSRGGFVGLAAVTAVWLLKAKHKLLAVLLVVVGVYVGISIVPERWFSRMETIGDAQEESAAGRINAWHFAWNLASSRPLVGGGFDVFTREQFERFAPDPYDFHDAHSIYFEILAEQGFIGLGLFLTLLLSTFASLRGLRRRYRRTPSSRWVADYASMLETCLVGYVTSGAFLGRAYFDLSYHLIASTIILKVLARQQATAPAAEPYPAGLEAAQPT